MEKEWLAEYAISMELIERYLRKMVEDKLAATDWEAEARSNILPLQRTIGCQSLSR